MKADASNGVTEIKRNGISIRIRPTPKNGTTYFVVDYRVQGQRKLVWRSTMAKARSAADNAIDKITDGQSEVLNLKSADSHAYVRAHTILDGSEGETKIDLQIDEAVRITAEILRLLAGRATPLEVTRDWLKRNAVTLPRITVADAVEEIKKQAKADGKSKHRQKQLAGVLNAFAESFNAEVHTMSPRTISDYLSGLAFKERTKRNHRDALGFFFRWLVFRGYLAKGTDLLEGVQNYTASKVGDISTYSAEEMTRLISAADSRIQPFIAIAGFAGLRHAEIGRLDWKEVDLQEKFIEVKAENSKIGVRRIIPIRDNLASWLEPVAKKSGKVITVANITKQLLKTAANTGDAENKIEPVTWKHNGLRHTYISARVAECADAPRVADEAGNSVQVIKTNYLKRMRPAAAAEWFSISRKATP
jgi:integrase